MMRFNTQYDHIKQPPESNSGITKVERAGYIPAQKRIENLMLAGQRLVQSRKEAFDFPDGKIDFSFTDPTRTKGFDMADAFQNMESINRKVEDHKAAVKASQNAQEAPSEPPAAKTGGE